MIDKQHSRFILDDNLYTLCNLFFALGRKKKLLYLCRKKALYRKILPPYSPIRKALQMYKSPRHKLQMHNRLEGLKFLLPQLKMLPYLRCFSDDK